MASQESFQAGAEGRDAASLGPFVLSGRLTFETREAGSKVHMGGSNWGWRKSLCQMRSPAGHGCRGGQGCPQHLALGNHVWFHAGKGAPWLYKDWNPLTQSHDLLRIALVGSCPQGLSPEVSPFTFSSGSFLLLHVPKPSGSGRQHWTWGEGRLLREHPRPS